MIYCCMYLNAFQGSLKFVAINYVILFLNRVDHAMHRVAFCLHFISGRWIIQFQKCTLYLSIDF